MVAEIEEFGSFAESQLNNHLMELHTQHTIMRPCSDEMMMEAYNSHRKMLNEELEQKLKTLIGSRKFEPVIKEGLLAIKKKYESNLIWNKKIEPIL